MSPKTPEEIEAIRERFKCSAEDWQRRSQQRLDDERDDYLSDLPATD